MLEAPDTRQKEPSLRLIMAWERAGRIPALWRYRVPGLHLCPRWHLMCIWDGLWEMDGCRCKRSFVQAETTE